jgi:hypothetical protein
MRPGMPLSLNHGFFSRLKAVFAGPGGMKVQAVRAGDTVGEIARLDPEAALQRLDSRAEGLSSEEAAARLERYGKNLAASSCCCSTPSTSCCWCWR